MLSPLYTFRLHTLQSRFVCLCVCKIQFGMFNKIVWKFWLRSIIWDPEAVMFKLIMINAKCVPTIFTVWLLNEAAKRRKQIFAFPPKQFLSWIQLLSHVRFKALENQKVKILSAWATMQSFICGRSFITNLGMKCNAELPYGKDQLWRRQIWWSIARVLLFLLVHCAIIIGSIKRSFNTFLVSWASFGLLWQVQFQNRDVQ